MGGGAIFAIFIHIQGLMAKFCTAASYLHGCSSVNAVEKRADDESIDGTFVPFRGAILCLNGRCALRPSSRIQLSY